MAFNKVLGIDLGTTNSCLAVMEGKSPVVINMIDGSRTLPSVVAYLNKEGSEEIIVGLPAKNQAVTNPRRTINAVKRLMGQSVNDPDVVKHKQNVSYEIREKNNKAVVYIDGMPKYPEEISATILRKIKEAAGNHYGFDAAKEQVKAVITVPAYFNNEQREATKQAGAIAGLDVIRIINEPTAAAIAYTYGKPVHGKKRLAVYDLGGGTFDISILEIEQGHDGADALIVEVLSTNGNTFLGGEDIDRALLDYIMKDIKDRHPNVNTTDPSIVQRVRLEAEKIKKDLSSLSTATVSLPFLSVNPDGSMINYSTEVSRAKLNELSAHIIDQTIEPCRKALKDANLSPNEVDEIILVGGMTRMPAVREAVKKFFGKEPKSDLNPDEIVACGAAIHGAQIQGTITDILLIDVTPLSLGIETLGGVFTPLIKRNTSIPTQASQIFSTAEDGQTKVVIKVYQGERSVAADNKILGSFELVDIPPAPRGVPKIEVSFNIDSNGIVHVTAQDKGTGKQQSLIIKDSNSLSKDEQERLVKEAEQYQEEDQKKLKALEAINDADTKIYEAEKMLKENESKLDSDLINRLNEKINTAKSRLSDVKSGTVTDVEELKAANEELTAAIMDAGKMIYSKGDDNSGSQAPSDNQE
jgi:molecular chaperone DnaK